MLVTVRRCVAGTGIALAAFSLSQTPGADAPGSPPAVKRAAPTVEEIARAVRQLGDNRFGVREKAQKLLWEAGAAAEPALRQALASGDAEVVRRARAVLDRFDWGVYPDTPPAVTAAVERYRGGDEEVKVQAVKDLAALGKPGLVALARLAAKADTPEARQFLGAALTDAAKQAVPLLLVERDLATAAALLEACLIGDTEDAVANYVAFVYLRGTLPAALAKWETEEGRRSPRAAEVRIALYRAKSDFATARRVAAEAKRDDLTDALLWEEGDWKALAERPELPERADPRFRRERSPAQALGLRAAYHRLAGNAKPFEEAIAGLKKLASGGPDDIVERQAAVEALLLNERAADALALLEKLPLRGLTFDLLAAQSRFQEAFAAAGRPVAVDDGDDRLDLKQARWLYLLGETDQAVQTFARRAGGLKQPGQVSEAAELIKTELRLGLKELAREHAARYLGELNLADASARSDAVGLVLEAAFPKRGAAAGTWWRFLARQFPHEDALARMKRLLGLLEPAPGANGSLPPVPADLAEALGQSLPEGKPDEDGAANPIGRRRTAARGHEALAEAYKAAGQLDAAEGQLTKAAESAFETGAAAAWLNLGDFQAERKRYAEAAVSYGEAVRRDKTQPLPLYLQGWALTQAGHAKEGQALTELAHWLPLGNQLARAMFAEELTKRDQLEAARRERDLVLRVGWYRMWYVGNVLNYLARDAAVRKEYAKAAAYYERGVVGCLRVGSQFVDSSAYLVVPQLVHQHRARAALAAGRVGEALAEAKVCLDLVPGNVDLTVQLVPELDKAGRKTDGDALYEKAAAVHKKLCADYPKGAFAHNSVAWLAACCRRDLDAALEHAKKATELQPQTPGYLDTLAEVYFQRGDTAKAIACMKKCRVMDPRKTYFGKQLRRFEAGDRLAPPPDEGDDD